MNRLKGFAIFVGGLVLMGLGIGMWRSSTINWEGFLGVWFSIANEIAKLVRNPFAILGVVVLIIGIAITYIGLRRIVSK